MGCIKILCLYQSVLEWFERTFNFLQPVFLKTDFQTQRKDPLIPKKTANMSNRHQQSFQDWNPVVFRSSTASATGGKKKTQTSGNTTSLRKATAGSNKQRDGVDSSLWKKLANEDEEKPVVLKTVPPRVARAIQQARDDAGITQRELANKISVSVSVIQQYEQKKAVPTQQVLAKLERALGVRLRGKRVGEPFENRKNKSSSDSKETG